MVNEADDLMKDKGLDQLSLNWKGGGGHRISAVRNADGKLFIYDEQSSEHWDGIDAFVRDCNGDIDVGKGIGIIRTDDKFINPKYIKGIVKKN